MLCPACHKEVAAAAAPVAFCNHCGEPLLAALPASPYVGGPTIDPPPVPGAAAVDGLTPHMAAAVSYVTFVPAVLFLVLQPYSKIPFVRFHSFQSIGLFLVWCIVRYAVVLFFPFGFLLRAMLEGLVLLLFFAIWLACVLKAVKSEWFKLPILGDIALKLSQS